LKEGLEKLHALQLLDDRIKEVEISLKQIPETIQQLELERDGKASIIEDTRNKLNENIKEREKLEKEIMLIKEKIKKYKEQMNKATTNKEYQGFMAEIKFEEENISTLEEKVIEKMLESDEIMNEIRESEEEFEKISREYNKKIMDLKGNLEFSKLKLAEAANEKQSLRGTIPEKLLRIYDNLARNKNGKAVSVVEAEFCGVCNVKIRPQRFNELLTFKEMLTCDSCGRILFVKQAAKEEKKEEENKNKNKNKNKNQDQ
jgi:predicted  nucleic acid-binding Zn-ribbon protein